MRRFLDELPEGWRLVVALLPVSMGISFDINMEELWPDAYRLLVLLSGVAASVLLLTLLGRDAPGE